MVTNKTEALRKFVERKGGIHTLTVAQRALIRVANTSHTKLAVPVSVVPTAVLSGSSPAASPTPPPTPVVPALVLPSQKKQALKRQRPSGTPTAQSTVLRTALAAAGASSKPQQRKVVQPSHPAVVTSGRVVLAVASAKQTPQARVVLAADPPAPTVTQGAQKRHKPVVTQELSLEQRLSMPLGQLVKKA